MTGPMAKVNPFRFSTKFDDDETDYLYYGYRYYNPSTGRWLSRDPFDEDGGVNLFSLGSNDLIDAIDPIGAEPYNFSIRDLGQRNVITNYGRHTITDGKTTLTGWFLLPELRDCACQQKIAIKYRGGVEFWWSSDTSRSHELNHVSIWLESWIAAVNKAYEYVDRCVPKKKASCWSSLIVIYSDASKLDAEAQNWEYDCSQYGQIDPNVCKTARKLRNDATKAMNRAQSKESECNSL